jgi:hypothetical protein
MEKSSQEGRALWKRFRTTCINRNTTAAAWATDNGLHPANVRAAVVGSWKGPKASSVLQQVRCYVEGEP